MYTYVTRHCMRGGQKGLSRVSHDGTLRKEKPFSRFTTLHKLSLYLLIVVACPSVHPECWQLVQQYCLDINSLHLVARRASGATQRWFEKRLECDSEATSTSTQSSKNLTRRRSTILAQVYELVRSRNTHGQRNIKLDGTTAESRWRLTIKLITTLHALQVTEGHNWDTAADWDTAAGLARLSSRIEGGSPRAFKRGFHVARVLFTSWYDFFRGEFPSYQNNRGEFPFTPYATVCMLREIFAHHAFLVEAYGYVCRHCREQWVVLVASATGTVVDTHTRRSTHAPKHSGVTLFLFVCVLICIT